VITHKSRDNKAVKGLGAFLSQYRWMICCIAVNLAAMGLVLRSVTDQSSRFFIVPLGAYSICMLLGRWMGFTLFIGKVKGSHIAVFIFVLYQMLPSYLRIVARDGFSVIATGAAVVGLFVGLFVMPLAEKERRAGCERTKANQTPIVVKS
jgi:hypothetical protein